MKTWFAHINVLILIVAGLLQSAVDAAELPPLGHGLTPVEPTKAPPLILQDMDDEIVDLSGYRGKVVVINYWATWCPPCRREMPSLERLNAAVGGRDVSVLAVNVGEDFETVFSFLGTIDPSPTFPLLFDHDGETVDAWKVRGLPTTFVVDKNGDLAYRAIGGREFDHPELVQKLIGLAQR